MMHRTALGVFGFAVAVLALAPESRSAAEPGFVATVKSTHPIAYYRLNAMSGSSEVGTSRYTAVGGVAPVGNFGDSSLCAPISVPGNLCTLFDGTSGYFDTSQMGGSRGAGSILAWVHLSARPAMIGRVVYIAGISQSGNDFDLQFEPDNTLRFYTAAGSNLGYKPDLPTLEGQWHWVVATLSEGTGTRAIYWDGVLATQDNGGGHSRQDQRVLDRREQGLPRPLLQRKYQRCRALEHCAQREHRREDLRVAVERPIVAAGMALPNGLHAGKEHRFVRKR
jgi:hypothetical protein